MEGPARGVQAAWSCGIIGHPPPHRVSLPHRVPARQASISGRAPPPSRFVVLAPNLPQLIPSQIRRRCCSQTILQGPFVRRTLLRGAKRVGSWVSVAVFIFVGEIFVQAHFSSPKLRRKPPRPQSHLQSTRLSSLWCAGGTFWMAESGFVDPAHFFSGSLPAPSGPAPHRNGADFAPQIGGRLSLAISLSFVALFLRFFCPFLARHQLLNNPGRFQPSPDRSPRPSSSQR